MIDELVFSRQYTSIWKLLTPTGEGFIRQLNAHLYEREFPPMKSLTNPFRRGLLNEIAFEAFCQILNNSGRSVGDDAVVDLAFASIVGQMARLQHVDQAELERPEGIEREEVRELIRRLAMFFRPTAFFSGIVAKPVFPGCGRLQRCQGDVLGDRCLYEIKSGERPFRSVDLRQLLTYCALNYKAQSFEIDEVALLNPRMGVSFRSPLDTVCVEISGRSASDLLPEVLNLASGNEISR